MNTTYSNGHLNIPLSTLFDMLDDEAKREMVERLACESAVIKAVAEQILDGWTEAGSHGATSYPAAPDPSAAYYSLDWAKREVARRAGDVAAKEIERLENALSHALTEVQRYRDLAYRPRQSW